MARTYARDSRGRFASKGTANLTTTLRGAAKAEKRLSFKIAYHGTNYAAAKAIKGGKFRESVMGLKGPGVYSSTDKQEATTYAQMARNIFSSKAPGDKTAAIVRLRLPKGSPRVVQTSYRANDWRQQAEKSYAAGQAAYWRDSSDRAVVLPGALADRYKDRSDGGVIRRRRRRR